MIATERNTRRDKYLESFAMQLADTDVPLPKGAWTLGPLTILVMLMKPAMKRLIGPARRENVY